MAVASMPGKDGLTDKSYFQKATSDLSMEQIIGSLWKNLLVTAICCSHTSQRLNVSVNQPGKDGWVVFANGS